MLIRWLSIHINIPHINIPITSLCLWDGIYILRLKCSAENKNKTCLRETQVCPQERLPPGRLQLGEISLMDRVPCLRLNITQKQALKSWQTHGLPNHIHGAKFDPLVCRKKDLPKSRNYMWRLRCSGDKSLWCLPTNQRLDYWWRRRDTWQAIPDSPLAACHLHFLCSDQCE